MRTLLHMRAPLPLPLPPTRRRAYRSLRTLLRTLLHLRRGSTSTMDTICRSIAAKVKPAPKRRRACLASGVTDGTTRAFSRADEIHASQPSAPHVPRLLEPLNVPPPPPPPAPPPPAPQPAPPPPSSRLFLPEHGTLRACAEVDGGRRGAGVACGRETAEEVLLVDELSLVSTRCNHYHLAPLVTV